MFTHRRWDVVECLLCIISLLNSSGYLQSVDKNIPPDWGRDFATVF
jgi:hypothetical protein